MFLASYSLYVDDILLISYETFPDPKVRRSLVSSLANVKI